MTEEEWLASPSEIGAQVRWMTHHLWASGWSERKLRLFGVACCRRIWDALPEGACRRAVDWTEDYADGRANGERMEDVCGAVCDWLDATELHERDAVKQAVYAARSVSLPLAFNDRRDEMENFAAEVADEAANCTGEKVRESRVQIALLRDIFGNPFRPVAFSPSWLTSTAIGIAQAIYEDRAFDRLPILADALQDAGCEDEQVLAHCRGDGPHVRGCWVVDGVLGKG